MDITERRREETGRRRRRRRGGRGDEVGFVVAATTPLSACSP